jgi:hypothetical protein
LVVAPWIGDQEPISQAMHTDGWLAPSTDAHVPALHKLQLRAPRPIEKAPGGHGRHTLWLVAADTLENEPGRHLKHSSDPSNNEYEPGAQLTQEITDEGVGGKAW